MLPVTKLTLGFNDAENYKRKENKELLNKLFVRDEELDKILDNRISFLIGEKGTGKTAYAIYISNNSYYDNDAEVRFIRETDYKKFVKLKKEHKLDLSDYSSIWKVILLMLISQQIRESEKKVNILNKFTKFKKLEGAIDEYYTKAFSPEIIQALQFIERSKLAAELLSKHAKASGVEDVEHSFSESRFQTNLLYIQKQFEEAISSLRLQKNHILFIDGIDIRPSDITYEEYIECINGLTNAVWELIVIIEN